MVMKVWFTDVYDSPLPDPTWEMEYYYDELNNSELYRHGDNHGDMVCLQTGHYPAGEPCDVLNVGGRTYITHVPSNTCCRSLHPIGMIKSDWLVNSNAAYNGTETINGNVVDQWWCIGGVNGENNYAAMQTEDQQPVAFWELKKGLPKRWDFLTETYVAGSPDPDLFTVPEDCSTFCK